MDGSREIQTHITTACLYRRQESCMERVNIVPTMAPFLHTPLQKIQILSLQVNVHSLHIKMILHNICCFTMYNAFKKPNEYKLSSKSCVYCRYNKPLYSCDHTNKKNPTS